MWPVRKTERQDGTSRASRSGVKSHK